MKMTKGQEYALKTVIHLLRENFDAGVVCLRITDDHQRSEYPAFFCGHLSEAIGLTAMAKETLELKFRMGKIVEHEEGTSPGYE
jgi:hypothetical protein